MTYIYSDKVIDSAIGAYVSPIRFDGVESSATQVYADDEKIVKAYKEVGIEVLPITEKKQAKKLTDKE